MLAQISGQPTAKKIDAHGIFAKSRPPGVRWRIRGHNRALAPGNTPRGAKSPPVRRKPQAAARQVLPTSHVGPLLPGSGTRNIGWKWQTPSGDMPGRGKIGAENQDDV